MAGALVESGLRTQQLVQNINGPEGARAAELLFGPGTSVGRFFGAQHRKSDESG